MPDTQQYYATRDQIKQDITATASRAVAQAQSRCDVQVTELNRNYSRESARLEGARAAAQQSGQQPVSESLARQQAAVTEQRNKLEMGFRAAADRDIGAARATESRHLAELDRTVQAHEQQRGPQANARSPADAQRQSQMIASQTQELVDVRGAQRGQERTR